MKDMRTHYDSIYNERIDKLRDILVPLPVFNKMVSWVEGTSVFEATYCLQFDNDPRSYDATDTVMCMPYPYLTSVAESQPIIDFADKLYKREDIYPIKTRRPSFPMQLHVRCRRDWNHS